MSDNRSSSRSSHDHDRQDWGERDRFLDASGKSEKKDSRSKAQKNWALGIVFLLCTVLSWGAVSILLKWIYNIQDMQSPFFVTFFTNGVLVIFLPIQEIGVRIGWTDRAHTGFSEGFSQAWLNFKKNWKNCMKINNTEPEFDEMVTTRHHLPLDGAKYTYEYTHYNALSVAMAVGPLWFFGNFCYNTSMFETTISSTSIISNLSGAFTLAFSYWAGVETVTISKLMGVLISFLGCVMVAIHDMKQEVDVTGDDDSLGSAEHRVLGDIMALAGAIMFGLYSPMLRLWVGDESDEDDDGGVPSDQGSIKSGQEIYRGPPRMPMSLVLGYFGLFTLVAGTPVMIFMSIACMDNFCSYTFADAVETIMTGLMTSVFGDYFLARAILLTSPSVAAVGLGLGTPLAIFIDIVLGTEGAVNTLSIIGGLLVVAGFLVLQLDDDQVKAIMISLGCGRGQAPAR